MKFETVLTFLVILSPLPTPGSCRKVKLGGKDCEYKGSSVCNGAVTKEIGSKLVKICTDGKIKTKTRKSVGEGYPLVDRDTGPGMDCTWYGTVFCHGDVVEDLTRWWFKMKCSKGKFSVDSVSYADVISLNNLTNKLD
eukprot:TRINITY_DN18125_c1_g1_i1.p1 TRINITY_DN18125_c1_g1~~TRINITY_DN18125_c1_g1_i1.p1  ORF type:complete len:138 (-),score=38.40 TRINITY_DN18125_c1_g1_i1:14-427(-)